MAIVAFAACSGPAFDPATVADATAQQVTRVEPLSWWTGMKTPLQLLVQGENISEYNVAVEGGNGVSVTRLIKADSPNFLFVDVKIAANAQPGTYYIVFSKDGESFKYPYEIAARDVVCAGLCICSNLHIHEKEVRTICLVKSCDRNAPASFNSNIVLRDILSLNEKLKRSLHSCPP